MSDYFFDDTQGNLWWADLDAISILLRRWAQAKAYAETMRIPETDGFQELSFNAARFQHKRETYHQREMAKVSQNIYSNPRNVVSQLIEKYNDIPRLQQEKDRTVRAVLSHNHQRLATIVRRTENTITALQITRDLSAAIFMCCIPGAGLSVEAAVLARLAGNIFQGFGTYQDTGNAVAAIATGVLSFKSSLFVLPATAGGSAQILFSVINTSNTTIANTAVRTLTVERGSGSNFTSILREEIISAGLSEATSPILEAVDERLEGKLIPIFINEALSRADESGRSTVAERISNSLNPSSNGQSSSPTSSNSRVRGQIAVARLRQEINQRSQQQQEAAWQAIPFNRFLATGDQNVLSSPPQQYVMGNLLRQGN